MKKKKTKQRKDTHTQQYFNEYDQDPTMELRQARKKKKMRRKVKVLIGLLIVVLIGAYFYSDISKVQSIKVVGNSEVPSSLILKSISISKKSIFLFVNTSKVENEVKEVGLIKKANVSRDLFGNVRIEVEEANRIAYFTFKKKTYIIDEVGHVVALNKSVKLEDLKQYPKLSSFKSLKMIRTFAKQYVKIPLIVRNSISDIISSPKTADASRVRLVMDSGKELVVRIESMAYDLQTSRFNYEAYVTKYSDVCVFSFEGHNIYMTKCK